MTIRMNEEIEFWVPMCCAKCEEKVREELLELDGVYEVFCDRRAERVTVPGHVDPFQALKKMKRIKRKSKFWNEGASIRVTHTPSLHTNHSPRRDSLHHESASQVAYYRQPSRRNSYAHSHGISYDSPHHYLRPPSPPFSVPHTRSFCYEQVPAYAQEYYTEEYPQYRLY